MDEETKPEKTIHQKIREMGLMVHAADDELNSDGLPVYFKLCIINDYYLVVDMMAKDEISVEVAPQTYKTIPMEIAEILVEVKEEVLDLAARLEIANKPTIPFMPDDNRQRTPYPADVIWSTGQPHELKPQKDEYEDPNKITGEN